MIEAKARFTTDLLRIGCQHILKTKDAGVVGNKVSSISGNDIHDTPAFDRKQHSNEMNNLKLLQDTTTSNQSMRA